MIVLRPADLETVKSEARAAYPKECCGLIAGERRGEKTIVTRVVPSKNLATGHQRDRFEIDPQVRFDLMRALEGTDEDIVGHYHSHPDHSAEPSATDLAMAYEHDLIWVIAATDGSEVQAITAHRVLKEAEAFEQIPLLVTDQSA